MTSSNESRAQRIARVMASMGFQPKSEISPHYKGYYKMYADEHDRTAMATVNFTKGFLGGLEKARLDGIIVTVQAVLPPMPDEVIDRAPVVMHADLLRALDELGGFTVREPEAVVVQQCGKCGKTVSEFMVDEDRARILCTSCFKIVKGVSHDN